MRRLGDIGMATGAAILAVDGRLVFLLINKQRHHLGGLVGLSQVFGAVTGETNPSFIIARAVPATISNSANKPAARSSVFMVCFPGTAGGVLAAIHILSGRARQTG